MSRLSELRKSRSATAAKVSQDLDSGTFQEDKRFWKVTRDKAGVGSAVIRFLPPVNGDDLPWVKLYQYAFQNATTKKWFINNCPSTIRGLGDCISPVLEANQILYNTGNEEDKKLASSRKRKTNYISNVLVIKDPAHPENDGTVRLMKYGKSIHDMIAAKMRPEFEDQVAFEAWDIDEGANFKLRIKNKDKYPSYESSEFDSQSALCDGDDDQMEAVLAQCHRLAEFIQPDQFKSYDQLKKEFDRFLNGTATPSAASQMEGENEAPVPQQRQRNVEPTKVEKAAPKVTAPVKVEKTVQADAAPDGSDSDLEYFKSLLSST